MKGGMWHTETKQKVTYTELLKGEDVEVGNAYMDGDYLLCDVTVTTANGDTVTITFRWNNKKKRAERHTDSDPVRTPLFQYARHLAENEMRDFLHLESKDKDTVGDVGDVVESYEGGVRILRCSVPVHVDGRDLDIEFEWTSETKKIKRSDHNGEVPRWVINRAYGLARTAIYTYRS